MGDHIVIDKIIISMWTDVLESTCLTYGEIFECLYVNRPSFCMLRYRPTDPPPIYYRFQSPVVLSGCQLTYNVLGMPDSSRPDKNMSEINIQRI